MVFLIKVWTILNFKVMLILTTKKGFWKAKIWRWKCKMCNCNTLHCFGEARFGENGGGDIGLVRERGQVVSFMHQRRVAAPDEWSTSSLFSPGANISTKWCSSFPLSNRHQMNRQLPDFLVRALFLPPWCKCKLQVIACWHHFCQCNHQYLPACCEPPFAPSAVWHLHQNGAFFVSKDASLSGAEGAVRLIEHHPWHLPQRLALWRELCNQWDQRREGGLNPGTPLSPSPLGFVVLPHPVLDFLFCPSDSSRLWKQIHKGNYGDGASW